MVFFLFMCSGCGDLKKAFTFTQLDEDGNEIAKDLSQVPAKTLLEQGMGDYNVGKYFTALEFFEEIMNRYPFSPEATLAELKAADCSFYMNRYLEALLLYEEFENRHPTNESIPYVMYQKAMCNYKQIDRVDRDTYGAQKAIALFKQLLKAYPDSPYSAEAKSRILTATEFMANHEFFVVEYYIRADKYDQAKVRLRYLLANYPMSQIAPKANKLLTQLENEGTAEKISRSWLPDWTIFGDENED